VPRRRKSAPGAQLALHPFAPMRVEDCRYCTNGIRNYAACPTCGGTGLLTFPDSGVDAERQPRAGADPPGPGL
jgi:hypothetical protein